MKSVFEYRAYAIAAEDGRYTAKSLDGESCELRSSYLLRVLRAVDTLWGALETASPPPWFKSWMSDPLSPIDLDTTAESLAQPEQCPISSCLKFPTKHVAFVNRVAAMATAAFALMEIISTRCPVVELVLA
jgi:hypothetical protein